MMMPTCGMSGCGGRHRPTRRARSRRAGRSFQGRDAPGCIRSSQVGLGAARVFRVWVRLRVGPDAAVGRATTRWRHRNQASYSRWAMTTSQGTSPATSSAHSVDGRAKFGWAVRVPIKEDQYCLAARLQERQPDGSLQLGRAGPTGCAAYGWAGPTSPLPKVALPRSDGAGVPAQPSLRHGPQRWAGSTTPDLALGEQLKLARVLVEEYGRGQSVGA